jgi:hypothetical protein
MGRNNQVSGDHNLIVGNGCRLDGIGNIVIGDEHEVNGNNNVIVSLTKQCIKGDNHRIVDDPDKSVGIEHMKVMMDVFNPTIQSMKAMSDLCKSYNRLRYY